MNQPTDPSSPPPAAALEGKNLGVCARLEKLREEQFGPRGKSEMARRLDIRPSTYDRYERDRVPPADLLVKIARTTNVTLEWLLTGEGPKRPPLKTDIEAEGLTRQFQEAITVRPDLRPGVGELLNWLDSLPRDAGEPPAPADAAPPYGRHPGESSATFAVRRDAANGQGGDDSAESLVPVIGNTSAGLARHWEEMPDDFGGEEADRRIEDLLKTRPQTAAREPGRLTGEAGEVPPPDVTLIQKSAADDDGLLEFLDSAEIRRRYPDAVAWRIDGDSMSPRYADGDFVITSRSVPAEPGQPCVARQKGQIGVNCKVYQPDGEDVLLIPINPRQELQRVPAADIEWAYRVLGTVTLANRQ